MSDDEPLVAVRRLLRVRGRCRQRCKCEYAGEDRRVPCCLLDRASLVMDGVIEVPVGRRQVKGRLPRDERGQWRP